MFTTAHVLHSLIELLLDALRWYYEEITVEGYN